MRLAILPAAIAALLAAIPAAAETETFTVDPRHTFPTYEVGHSGYSFQRGRFNKTSGRITLDTAAKTGSAEITIDTASVSTGVEKLEEHLRSEDFFNAAKNPTLTFKSTSFTFDGDKPRKSSGELTMAGVTRPVTFEVTYFNCGIHPMTKRKICGADMSATVKRSDFGMKYGLPALSDDVLLRVNVEAIKDQ
jgi:polyisoprenoid-binding protein YceI